MSITNAVASLPNISPWMILGTVGLLLAFYVTRAPAHRSIRSLTRVAQNAMRLAAIPGSPAAQSTASSEARGTAMRNSSSAGAGTRKRPLSIVRLYTTSCSSRIKT